MMLLIIGAIVCGVILLVAFLFAMFIRSKGTQVIHPEESGDFDYDGFEDKEFLCRNCGEPVDPFDDECGNCGAVLEGEFECQYCGEHIDDPRELVCPACGEALLTEVTVCPACNSVVPNNSTHCGVCGSDYWSPIYLSPRKAPKFVPPPEPVEGEEEESRGEEEEEASEEDY